jgi:hypothetical protein
LRRPSTGQSLEIYAEEVEDRDQEQAIIVAVQRGVRVRLVCSGEGDIRTLESGGVQVTIKKAPCCAESGYCACPPCASRHSLKRRPV